MLLFLRVVMSPSSEGRDASAIMINPFWSFHHFLQGYLDYLDFNKYFQQYSREPNVMEADDVLPLDTIMYEWIRGWNPIGSLLIIY